MSQESRKSAAKVDSLVALTSRKDEAPPKAGDIRSAAFDSTLVRGCFYK